MSRAAIVPFGSQRCRCGLPKASRRAQTECLKKSWGIIWQDVSPLEFMTPPNTDFRLTQLHDWLQTLAERYRLDLSTLAPASADASFRRYFRLTADSDLVNTFIVFDSPSPEKCREFVRVARLLRDAGVHVAQIVETDFDAGFM